MITLKDLNSKFPKIPQRGSSWCIPACFENILVLADVTGINQESLILEYCRKHGDQSLITKDGQPITIKGRTNNEVLKLAKLHTVRNASFGTFKQCAEKLCKQKGYEIKLDLCMGLKDQKKYIKLAKKFISQQSPVLISANNLNGTFHISVVVGFEHDKLYFYDPALNDFRLEGLNSLKFSTDMLRLVQ